jgi:SAM-dependent methyltransferase
MKTGHNLLYGRLAWVFPILSPQKTYLKETALFSRLIRTHARRPVKTLLHLGCGAGHNDFIFKKSFTVAGVDRSRAMLRRAKKLNPEAVYRRADMRTVRLSRTFDAVAIVDSLDYITTRKDLKSVFRTAHRHLNPGGVLFFLLETTRDTFRPNRINSWTTQASGLTGAFIELSFVSGRPGTTYEKAMVFLIRKGTKVKVYTDLHRFGLFQRKQVLRLLRETGFRARCVFYKPSSEALEPNASNAQARHPMFFAVKPLT